ncbi:lipid-A-disaccharide synthase [Halotalea alkalilenta]|uniref:Lipid-A-disaccharide synthase n=1 Tax=Halotalea alkalilenta TaxID=376489 RepID=A0A172YCK2_9GAMM|nr:lipid-A-disaccharide synthase [Halotalea alkalilenta]ANF56944.1 lipid-A-disaccharide synthase [Halotalea alkalilenta]
MIPSPRPLKVFVVAGELSGDVLGAGLLRELKRRYPGASFRGIGGPRMIAAGLESLAPLERLSIMGLVEVLKHLPGLIQLRRMLRKEALDWRADVMVGIDAPDFNLGLERQLREVGIRTVHYVSPSVWAWRQGRVEGIRRAVDLMLTFLPFEAAFYREHGVPVRFIGHPLADELPLDDDASSARRALGIEHTGPLLAMLPGSRHNEVRLMLPVYLETLALLRQRQPALRAVLPAASPARRAEIEALLDEQAREAITLIDGDAALAMVAADAVLLTSGTSALEAMLCHRPMVVAYRMAPITHWIAQRVVKTEWISLPNLIARETLVPELIQHDATAPRIAALLEPLLTDPQQALRERFARMHAELALGASASAADAVAALVEKGPQALASEREVAR